MTNVQRIYTLLKHVVLYALLDIFQMKIRGAYQIPKNVIVINLLILILDPVKIVDTHVLHALERQLFALIAFQDLI